MNTIRENYMMIHMIENDIKEFRNSTAVAEYLKDLKRQVRTWNKQESKHIVKDYGIDGYIELVTAPAYCKTEADVDDWFEDYVRIYRRHSAYDCTGQAFTSWYKPVLRNGHWFVYHSIGFDV